MENLTPTDKFKIGDIVTYNGEPCVIVDTEEPYLWIRNVMDPRQTEKVRKDEVTPNGGYGQTTKEEEIKPSVVLDRTSNLSSGKRAQLEKLTAQISGKTYREIAALNLPSA
ncbi:hypothetical protein J7J83_02595 [bacterium]|nr:hypothetical protein [bacterium]